MGKITIIDVARLAGVSTATVSRAMHSPEILRPSTLERVRAVMQEHGYIYNAIAGDFSRRRSAVIGVLVLSSTTKVATTVQAAQVVASEQGFPLMLCSSGFDPRVEREHLQHFLERGVAGILVIGHMEANWELIQSIQKHGIPCVFLWEVLAETNNNYVGYDNIQGSYSMVTHLIDQGYTRIGFISGINTGVYRIVKRYKGYLKALEAKGIPFDEELVKSATSTFANGKNAMRDLMALANPPRCVCCGSDVLAMGAVAAVTEAGLKVPDHFCIAGYDNSEFSAYTNPTLTTVDVPGEEMGRLGMQALMQLVQDKNHPPIQQKLPTSILLRGSTCPAGQQKELSTLY